MPRDLFAPSVRQSASARGRLLPYSLALHVLVLAAVVIAPLLAVGPLPPVRGPLAYRVTEVVIPKLPPPATRDAGLARAGRPSAGVVQPAPTAAPSSLDVADVPAVAESIGAAGVPAGGIGVDGGLPGGLPSGDVVEPIAPPAPPTRVGGRIKPPLKLRDVPPTYPVLAQQARVEGIVILDAVIGPDGRVRDLRVLRSVPLLDEAALEAVRRWVFTPTLLNGEPVAVAMTITVQFRLAR